MYDLDRDLRDIYDVFNLLKLKIVKACVYIFESYFTIQFRLNVNRAQRQ